MRPTCRAFLAFASLVALPVGTTFAGDPTPAIPEQEAPPWEGEVPDAPPAAIRVLDAVSIAGVVALDVPAPVPPPVAPPAPAGPTPTDVPVLGVLFRGGADGGGAPPAPPRGGHAARPNDPSRAEIEALVRKAVEDGLAYRKAVGGGLGRGPARSFAGPVPPAAPGARGRIFVSEDHGKTWIGQINEAGWESAARKPARPPVHPGRAGGPPPAPPKDRAQVSPIDALRREVMALRQEIRALRKMLARERDDDDDDEDDDCDECDDECDDHANRGRRHGRADRDDDECDECAGRGDRHDRSDRGERRRDRAGEPGAKPRHRQGQGPMGGPRGGPGGPGARGGPGGPPR